MSQLGAVERELPDFSRRFLPFALLCEKDALKEGWPDYSSVQEGVLLLDLWDGDGQSCAVVLVEEAHGAFARKVANRLEDLQLFLNEPKRKATFNLATSKASAELLDICSLGCDLEKIKRCAAEGADLNVQSRYGVTPLHMAAERGLIEVVQYLLDHGATAGVLDKDGMTPQEYAQANRHSWVVELLALAAARAPA